MPGRKRTPFSQPFTDVDSCEAKIPRVKCRFCQTSMAKNELRMEKHMKKCQSCPPSVLERYASKTNKKSSESEPDEWLLDFTTADEKKRQPPKSSSSSVLSFADRMQKEDEVKLDTLFARAIYASGTLFSIVENCHWKAFFKALPPAYVLPSRFQLSNSLLDAEFERVRVDMFEKLASTDAVAIMADGWSNIRNEPIINFVISMPQPVFWQSIHTKLESHSGDYIANQVAEVIDDLSKSRKVIVTFISDNANNMKKDWKLLQERYLYLSCYGCAAHGLNLVFSDLAKLDDQY